MKQAQMMIEDELGNSSMDNVKKFLRTVDGVPPYTYKVMPDRKVFVFEKLANLFMDELVKKNPHPEQEIAKLIKQSVISAKEAVMEYGITPAQYEVRKEAVGWWSIYHRDFSAMLPGHYHTKERAMEALAGLIFGEVIPGQGNFKYRNQSMTIDPFPELPVQPLVGPFPTNVGNELELNKPPYHPEASFTEAFYKDIGRQETAWKPALHYIENWVNGSSNKLHLWKHTAQLKLNYALEDASLVLNTDRRDGLRSLYPELSGLSDAVLCGEYDAYQQVQLNRTSTMLDRSIYFLFFLLGRNTNNDDDYKHAIRTGQLTAFHFLVNHNRQPFVMECSYAFGRAAAEYDLALTITGERIRKELRFLWKDAQKNPLTGDSIFAVSNMDKR